MLLLSKDLSSRLAVLSIVAYQYNQLTLVSRGEHKERVVSDLPGFHGKDGFEASASL